MEHSKTAGDDLSLQAIRILDASPVPYALNDDQQKITYLNPAFTRVFGYDINDIPTLADWWPKAYPDAEYRRWVATTWTNNLEEAKRTNAEFEPIELRIRCKDQSYKIASAQAASLTGSYKGIHLVVLHDITESIHSANEISQAKILLENVINSSPDLIFVKNVQLETVLCNKAYAATLGKCSEELHYDAEQQFSGKEDRDAINGIAVHKPNQKTVINDDTRFFDVHKLPLRNTSNEIIGMLGICRDITHARLAEEKLRITQKMDALGKLTGGIAHDFNNMLGVILGYAELLEQSFTSDENNRRYVQEIITAGNRARKLTSNLLTFSRRGSSESSPICINEQIRKDQDMLERVLTAQIQLELDLAADLWPCLIDEELLGDAILNISINAMQAMPEGGKLSITTRNCQLTASDTKFLSLEPGEYVQLGLSDTGIGMDEEARHKIFEPFFSTKGERGTGLGMSQVYGLVKQAQGDIYVESYPGHGTRITIYFPRHLDPQQLENISTAEDATEQPLVGHQTILVVDDEPALRELSREILENSGYQVLVADSGQQALRLIETNHVDLILCDIIMPGMNGFELINTARDKYPDIKVQMISGYSDDYFISAENRQLHQERLQKPCRAETLLTKIKEHFDK